MSEPASPPGAQGPQGAAGAPATGKPPTTISAPGQESLTPLEREVLEEYVELRDNLQSLDEKLSPLLSNLATRPTPAILDALRVLERKTSLVSTLLKASVYSIVLQQEMFDGSGEDPSEGPSEGRSHTQRP